MTELIEHTGASLVTWAAEAEAAAGIARALAGTNFIPDSLKLYRDPDRTVLDMDGTVAQVAAALMTGQELGLSPMASLRSIDVIPPGTGSPALRAVALRALIQQHGHDIWVVESTDTRAIVEGRRAGSDVVHRSTWTLDRAARLGVRGFNDPRGSWKRQPGVMLVARATAEIARWIASDVLLGLPYIVEEMLDDLEDDGTGPVALQPPARTPRRRAASRSRARGRAPLTALPSADRPSADAVSDEGRAEPGETETGDDDQPRMSPAQRGRFWAGMRSLGYTAEDREAALKAVSGWVKREVTHTNQLSEAEAGTALDEIQAELDRRAAVAAGEDAAEDAP